MSRWPSWLKVSGSSASYDALEQNELDEHPNSNHQAATPAATTRLATAPLGGRRSWHRLLVALVLVLSGVYLVQSGVIFGGSDDYTETVAEPVSNPYTDSTSHSNADSSWTGSQAPYDDLADLKDTSHTTPISTTAVDDSPLETSSAAPFPPDASSEHASESKNGTASGRKVRLLLPATRIDKHLCKAIFTATTMGYPKPVLINWGMKPAPGEYAVSHLAKVGGIKTYLQSLGPEAADDLVVIADAIDLWFNLPVDVLLERYEKILEADNEYIRQLWGQGALDNGIRATTVFASDKGCAGYFPPNHWCWLQPESTLPVDTYGNKTGGTSAGYGTWTSFRPRYLNSGLIVGPVKDILAILRRAEDFIAAQHIDKLVFWQSDQRIIIMAFAEQQLARWRKAKQNPQWRDSSTPLPRNRTSPYANPRGTMNLDVHPDFDDLDFTKIDLQSSEDFMRYEFGIAIDYESMLSHTTSSADHEWAYLRYDPTQPQEVPKLSDPRDCRVRVNDTLPDDIASTPIPYADIVGNDTHPVAWDKVPLYTNLCSGSIPAVIHHNGDKAMREAQWPSLWFTGKGFEILKAARKHAAEHPELDLGNGDAISDKGEVQMWKDICWVDERDMFEKELVSFAPGATTWGVPPQFFHGASAYVEPDEEGAEDIGRG